MHVAGSNDVFAKCKAKFILNSKDPENILKIEREAKKSLFKFNYNSTLELENWEVEPNSVNFKHSFYCQNQIRAKERIYDFVILNSKNCVEIQKEKRKYTCFNEEAAFPK